MQGSKHIKYQSGIERSLIDDRINWSQWVEVEGKVGSRLVVFTEKTVMVMRGSGVKSCQICPAENMCPTGPRVEHSYPIGKLQSYVVFEDIPQRLVLNFASGAKGGKLISLALLITSSFDSQVLIDHLKTLKTASSLPDYLLSGSLFHHLNDPDTSPSLLCYVSLNPTTTTSKAQCQSAYPPSTDLPLLPNPTLLALTSTEILLLK